MSADNLEGQEVEGQEVDVLIRELSSKRKLAAAKPAVTPPPAPTPVAAPVARSFRAFGTNHLIMPARVRKTFVSAISFPSLSSVSLPRMPELTMPAMLGQVAVVRMCVGLGVLLSSAMPYWPYPKACTWWLLFYLFAVGMVLVAGIWSARLTWKTRLAVAHIVALGVVFWGITLAAEETLPRIGYAKTEAAWFCE